MGSSQRRKGGEGKRELVRQLRNLVGEPVERNVDQPPAGGGDGLLHDWSVEAKRAKQGSLGPWWARASEQAEALGVLARPGLLPGPSIFASAVAPGGPEPVPAAR